MYIATYDGESCDLEVDFDRAVNDLKGVHVETSALMAN